MMRFLSTVCSPECALLFSFLLFLAPFLWKDVLPFSLYDSAVGCSDGCCSLVLSRQQTTVEEQSRIMQLEEELTLRRAEIQNLQAQMRSADASGSDAPAGEGEATRGSDAQPEVVVLLREQLLTAGRERYKESSELKEKYETALGASQQEIDSLKAVVDKQNVEINELKQKVQQATKENVEMMDTWKVFGGFLLTFKELQ